MIAITSSCVITTEEILTATVKGLGAYEPWNRLMARPISGDEPPIQSKPKPAFIRQAFRRIIASHWRTYVSKLKGVQTFGPRRRQMPMDVFWTFLVSLSVCLFLTSLEHFVVSPTRFVFMIPSFAVIAALIFDNFTAPLAQPRNVICGNLIGAVVACTIVQLFGVEYRWLLTPLAVSIVGALQMLTGTIHPPGGSIALYVLYGPQKVRDLGFLYMLMPILVGAVFFVVAATAVLNVFSRRYYPKYWW